MPEIAVHCAHSELVPVADLKSNPRNPNKHGPKQVAMLAKIIETQGWRQAIVVSNQSGFIVKGHGRLAAALLLGETVVPVDYQDYETEEAEFADLLADNRIADLSEIDETMLALILQDLNSAGTDLDLTGFDSAELEKLLADSTPVPPSNDPNAAWTGMPTYSNVDKTAWKSVLINFASPEDMANFAALIGQTLTEKTRSVWYPKAEIERCMDKQYAAPGEE